MIRESLVFIASNFLAASNEPFKGNAVASYVRDDAANDIAAALGNPYFLVEGSPGKGRWADVPWISVFDPAVTDSATRGYYVVYLFSADLTTVHLCLAQGTTSVREEFKRQTHDELRRLAALMRARLPEAKGRFSAEPIILGGSTTLARDYEPSVAVNASYSIANLPSEDRLRDDLHEMIRLYSMLIARGGRDNFEDVTGPESSDTEGDTITERRRYRLHRKIERAAGTAKRVKKVHGLTCQCCGFNFGAIYGDAGAGYIEAHHLTPLAELPEDVPVSQDPKKDFAVLCANCHRMIHRKDTPKTVAALQSLGNLTTFRAAIEPIGRSANASASDLFSLLLPAPTPEPVR